MEREINPSNVDIKLEALCPSCKNVHPLEACLDCLKPMCSECMNVHFDEWKNSTTKYSKYIDRKVDNYLEKLKPINQVIDENNAKVIKVKADIEETFNSVVEKLNNEKMQIFQMLDQIQCENNKYKIFESTMLDLKENFKQLQEAKEKKSDNDPRHSLMIDKFKQCKDQIQKIGVIFNEIKTKPFKIIGEYDKPKPLESSFFGNLIVNDSDFALRSNKLENYAAKCEDKNVKNENKVHMFGTLRVKLRQIAEQYSDFKQTYKSPFVEFKINIQPQFLASFKSQLFIVQENGSLILMESLLDDELKEDLKLKLETKLNIVNIRAISVNSNILAAIFSNLTKENVKSMSNKKLHKVINGVALFKWNESFNFEKCIDLSNTKLVSPTCVLNETDLFVSDRELGILRFDIKSGNLKDKLAMKEFTPNGICLFESKNLACVNLRTQELNLIDSENFSKSLKTAKLAEELQTLHGSYDLVMKKNSCLFIKNHKDSQIFVYDLDLNVKNVFEHNLTNNLGITLVDSLLVIGKLSEENESSKSYKISLFKDF